MFVSKTIKDTTFSHHLLEPTVLTFEIVILYQVILLEKVLKQYSIF